MGRAMVSLQSQWCTGIAYMTGVLRWMDTGSSGRTGWESEEMELPCTKEQQERMEIYLGMAHNTGDVVAGVCHGAHAQEKEVDKVFRQLKLHFHMLWPSRGTSATLISAGVLMQQSTRNSGIFLIAQTTISWHSQRGEELCCSWYFHRKTGCQCECWEQPQQLQWP